MASAVRVGYGSKTVYHIEVKELILEAICHPVSFWVMVYLKDRFSGHFFSLYTLMTYHLH